MKPEKVLLYVVGGILLFAVVGGTVAALRPPPEFESGTPEAVVQGYLQAVFEGDAAAAEAYLSDSSACHAADIERALGEESARVVLRDTRVEDAKAQVRVEMVFSSGGPFDTYEYSQNRTFFLGREGDDWKITGQPWPVFSCEELNR